MARKSPRKNAPTGDKDESSKKRRISKNYQEKGDSQKKIIIEIILTSAVLSSDDSQEDPSPQMEEQSTQCGMSADLQEITENNQLEKKLERLKRQLLQSQVSALCRDREMSISLGRAKCKTRLIPEESPRQKILGLTSDNVCEAVRRDNRLNILQMELNILRRKLRNIEKMRAALEAARDKLKRQ